GYVRQHEWPRGRPLCRAVLVAPTGLASFAKPSADPTKDPRPPNCRRVARCVVHVLPIRPGRISMRQLFHCAAAVALLVGCSDNARLPTDQCPHAKPDMQGAEVIPADVAFLVTSATSPLAL